MDASTLRLLSSSFLMYYNLVKVAKKTKVFDESVDSLTRPCHLERSEKPLAHDPEVGSNLLSVNAVGGKTIKDVSLRST